MTQFSGGRVSFGTIAIGLAALVLGAALGLSLARRSETPAEPSVSATQTAGDAAAPTDAMAPTSPVGHGGASDFQAQGAALFDAGHYDDAVQAYDKATRAEPGRAELWSALGEARVMASKSDPLPAQAAADFARALSLDRHDPRARYFMGVKKDLAGDHHGAISDWLALLADTPHGAPWESDLRRTIMQVGAINHIAVAGPLAAIHQPGPPLPQAAAAIPGPSAQDLQAATAIPPSQQRAMAEGMVAKLDARLQSETHDVDGWIMLMRSRMTLGQPALASAALRRAIAANPASAPTLRQQAAVLGVK